MSLGHRIANIIIIVAPYVISRAVTHLSDNKRLSLTPLCGITFTSSSNKHYGYKKDSCKIISILHYNILSRRAVYVVVSLCCGTVFLCYTVRYLHVQWETLLLCSRILASWSSLSYPVLSSIPVFLTSRPIFHSVLFFLPISSFTPLVHSPRSN